MPEVQALAGQLVSTVHHRRQIADGDDHAAADRSLRRGHMPTSGSLTRCKELSSRSKGQTGVQLCILQKASSGSMAALKSPTFLQLGHLRPTDDVAWHRAVDSGAPPTNIGGLPACWSECQSMETLLA